MIIAIAVTGLNLITGYTGQLSLGHAAFFAIGAYISAMLVTGKVTTPFFEENLWTPGWTLPVAAVRASSSVAWSASRRCVEGHLSRAGHARVRRGRAFDPEVRRARQHHRRITGHQGLDYLPPSWTGLDGRADLNKWFLYLAAFLLVSVAGLSRAAEEPIGRAMVATRDNETAAAVMGVHLATIKTVVFGISAAIAGIAGSLYALKLTLVDPDVPKFGLLGSITFVVALVVGGAAQQWGPFVAPCSTCSSTTTPARSAKLPTSTSSSGGRRRGHQDQRARRRLVRTDADPVRPIRPVRRRRHDAAWDVPRWGRSFRSHRRRGRPRSPMGTDYGAERWHRRPGHVHRVRTNIVSTNDDAMTTTNGET